MKRIAIVLVAALLVVPLLAGPASAREVGIRRYRAETSDGQVLRFRTVREDTGRRLDAVFFRRRFELTCDDDTTKEIGGRGFTQWPWYFDGRTVTVDETSESRALHLVGTFTRTSASGTLRFDEVYGARLCTTGDVTWTAERV